MGIPVIGTRAEGIQDVLGDEEFGLMFSNGDTGELAEKIKAVLYDPDIRKELIGAGRKRAEEFSMERTLDAYESFFGELIGQRPD